MSNDNIIQTMSSNELLEINSDQIHEESVVFQSDDLHLHLIVIGLDYPLER